MKLTEDEVKVAMKCVNLAMANPGRFPIEYRAKIQALRAKLEGKGLSISSGPSRTESEVKQPAKGTAEKTTEGVQG